MMTGIRDLVQTQESRGLMSGASPDLGDSDSGSFCHYEAMTEGYDLSEG